MFWLKKKELKKNRRKAKTHPDFSKTQMKETSPLYSDEGIKVEQVKMSLESLIVTQVIPRSLTSGDQLIVCSASDVFAQDPVGNLGSRQGPHLSTRLCLHL